MLSSVQLSVILLPLLALQVHSAAPDHDLGESNDKTIPHLSCFRLRHPPCPGFGAMDYSTVKRGKFAVIFVGLSNAGKSTLIQRLTGLKGIASGNKAENGAGWTQQARDYVIEKGDVEIHALDSVGFGDGSYNGRKNIITALGHMRKMLIDKKLTLKRIYFILDRIHPRFKFVGKNLELLIQAYGRKAISNICFLSNKCESADDNAYIQWTERLQNEYVKVLGEDYKRKFKVLFVSGRGCLGQLYDDIRMAGSDDAITLEHDASLYEYFVLPEEIKQLESSIENILGVLTDRRTELNDCRQRYRQLELDNIPDTARLNSKTNDRDAKQRTIRSLDRQLESFNFSGTYQVDENRWRLMDILDLDSNLTTHEVMLMDATLAVMESDDTQTSKKNSEEAIEYVDSLLGANHAVKFHVLQFILKAIEITNNQEIRELKPIISEVLKSRTELYDYIRGSNDITRLDADLYKDVHSQTRALRDSAEKVIPRVRLSWNSMKTELQRLKNERTRDMQELDRIQTDINDLQRIIVERKQNLQREHRSEQQYENDIKNLPNELEIKHNALQEKKRRFHEFETMLWRIDGDTADHEKDNSDQEEDTFDQEEDTSDQEDDTSDQEEDASESVAH